jgi:hypothetical protein
MSELPSPWARVEPGMRIKEGAPAIQRPTKEQIEGFPNEANTLIDESWKNQKALIDEERYDASWLDGQHLVIVGGTGRGLGGAVSVIALNNLERLGSLTVIGRDMKRSMEFAFGTALQERAAEHADKFHWLNGGISVEGDGFDAIVELLKDKGVKDAIYVNGVAAASSGLMPGLPPVYVKDIDEEGTYVWQLTELPERSIEATKSFMGTMTIQFPDALEAAGINVEVAAYADWRGSLDRGSRHPQSPTFGRWGSYSTSLYLPKDIIQDATRKAYADGRKWIDVFFPTMRTRALPYIPGGVVMSRVYDNVLRKSGISRIDIPELGLGMVHQIGQRLHDKDDNPFPRYDAHEAPFDEWLYEILNLLTDDESSKFYYEKWLD